MPNKLLTPREVLREVGNGLTRDKLTYFVRAGYIKPRKVKRKTLWYSLFTEKDKLIIKTAWDYIAEYDMRVNAAFKRAEHEYNQFKLDFQAS
jgi:hypothetical protein